MKELKWEWIPWRFNPSLGNAWRAQIPGHKNKYLWLEPWDTQRGINYVSSWGPNHDNSFSGFLPGLTMDQAKERVLKVASKHWR